MDMQRVQYEKSPPTGRVQVVGGLEQCLLPADEVMMFQLAVQIHGHEGGAQVDAAGFQSRT